MSWDPVMLMRVDEVMVPPTENDVLYYDSDHGRNHDACDCYPYQMWGYEIQESSHVSR